MNDAVGKMVHIDLFSQCSVAISLQLVKNPTILVKCDKTKYSTLRYAC